ncbi:MAG: hypothetical protein RL199_1577, partial [Pseudomonadota bacterium]
VKGAPHSEANPGASDDDGAVAQLGERLNGIQEVTGSIPVSSTNSKGPNPPRIRAFRLLSHPSPSLFRRAAEIASWSTGASRRPRGTRTVSQHRRRGSRGLCFQALPWELPPRRTIFFENGPKFVVQSTGREKHSQSGHLGAFRVSVETDGRPPGSDSRAASHRPSTANKAAAPSCMTTEKPMRVGIERS